MLFIINFNLSVFFMLYIILKFENIGLDRYNFQMTFGPQQ